MTHRSVALSGLLAIAVATAPSGQPGVRVGESGEDLKGAEPAATVMAVGPRTAVPV